MPDNTDRRAAYKRDLLKLVKLKKAGKKLPSSTKIQAFVRSKHGLVFSASTIRQHLIDGSKARIGDAASYPSPTTPDATVEALVKEAAPKPRPDVFKVKPAGEAQVIESLSSGRIKTVEDALKKGGVDAELWDVDHFIVNSWEMGAKGPDDRICVTPLWQVKVWLKAKKGWSPTEFRSKLLADMKALAPVYHPATYSRATDPILAMLGIFDPHFGKLGWRPESGQDYDLPICRDRYMGAGSDLIARTAAYAPERFLYVVGQDFFHVDQGRHGMTTNNTPQDCDGRWQKAFRIGKDCTIGLIEQAVAVAPVDVLISPGNHDAEKAFCLGEVLAARFNGHKNVNVINDPSVFSYYRWGVNLLGFVHGDTITSDKKRAQLPATMATDRPKDWAETFCRDWFLGHFHSESQDIWHHRREEHVREVGVRIMPSLAGTDAWHRHNNYKSPLAAEMHLYHKTRGRYGMLVHQVDHYDDLRGRRTK